MLTILVTTTVLLGQLYPSGRAYLQRFQNAGARAEPPLAVWPAAVELHCLRAEACKHAAVGHDARTAKRGEYVPGTRDGTVFLPSLEEMDDSHDQDCRLKTKKNPKYSYIGDDHFDVFFPSCQQGDIVVRYDVDPPKAVPKDVSYQVLAVPAGVKLVGAAQPPVGTKRPLTDAEKPRVAAARNEAATKKDCTTEPGFLDQARVLYTAGVEGSARAFRISTYGDPGCYGHMATIYLMDELEAGKVVVTRDLVRYTGVL